MGSSSVEFEVYSFYAAVCICKKTKSVTRMRGRENDIDPKGGKPETNSKVKIPRAQ